jgi:RHS repeat-associated protein
MTGVESNQADTRANLQNTVNALTVFWDARSSATGNFQGYNNASAPSNLDNVKPQVINYYDDYNIPDLPYSYASSYSNRTKGLLTATKVKVLGSTNDFLWTVNYYDDEGQVVKTYRQHYLSGSVNAANYDEISYTYNFSGELTASTRDHCTTGVSTTITNRYEYDHMGRQLATMQEINGQGEVVLSKLDYNEIGQLKTKNQGSLAGSPFLQSTNFGYNERGWMTTSMSGLFNLRLSYQENSSGQYNGNISKQAWGSGTNFSTGVYSYTYDKLNRLLSAVSTGIVMSETITYDVMGNINTLKRDAGTANKYYYNGNQLSYAANITDVYEYDENGNASKDGRKGYNIQYNQLNLPSVVSNGINLSFVYDASGRKLQEISAAGTVNYVDGIQYKPNGTIDFIQTAEGVARSNAGGGYSYEYNLADHLGNSRITYYKNPSSNQVEVIQRDNYYAFGLRKIALEGNNKYLYNGKELQSELGQYDYGARFYDPVIGRWNVVDPITDLRPNISPYTYCVNNPILYIDKFGLDSLNAIHYLKEVVIRGYKTLATISPLFPKLDNSLKMFTDWTEQKKDKYPAGNFTDLAYNATRRNAQASVVKGDLLNRVKKDPAFLAWRKQIIAQYKLNPLINKRRQPLKLGGDKFFSMEGDIELRLSIRGAWVNANFVESNGATIINYGIDDTFDIRQQGGRGLIYNGINGVLEPIWVDVFHGNENMNVEVRWNEKITK